MANFRVTGHFDVQLRKSIPSIQSKKHNRFTFLNLVIMTQADRHVDRLTDSEDMISNNSLALVFSSRSIKVSPRFVLGRENVPCVADVVNRSLKADCTDFTSHGLYKVRMVISCPTQSKRNFQN